MKIKVLSRNPDDYGRETKRDIQRLPRNYDPALHPFEAAREYTRALNATKLERVFAKPFVGALDGHRDGVNCMAKHPGSLSTLLTGACDGEIKIWNLGSRDCRRTIQAHTGFVRGMCVTPDHGNVLSIGDDKTIKMWSLTSPEAGEEEEEPVQTILGKSIFTGIDHHWKDATFATCGQTVDIWDHARAEPLRSFSWGVDSLNCVRFNPIEKHYLASCAADRSIILYDTRGSSPLRKVILNMRSNVLAWNPMEAFVFTVANEDHNLYSFDIRRLTSPFNIHMDHVNAVLDLDYSPTGREFVSGSFDKTIRIFPLEKGRSREVYHTKRMQRVFCIKWSLDNKYILSGSDETNVRIWKAKAAEKIGKLTPREESALTYSDKLKEKFQHHPQVRRIARHRHVPKEVYHLTRQTRIMKDSRRRKEENRIRHSKPGSIKKKREREKVVVAEQE
ncbi:PREDICTED: DDB1- and CUL4-associated factor 13-like [Branchiostoma belcheri]|uniref:DDB1- and CUL4-associated factor 13 n=1 Tax=Branchiostoma belcheri TaxID=7741 RepID=A0A6P4ZG13_BRABE|nr:PREDICTED: DDB1- and CUL4-associated factor 13-like [Branchiostoma belcheri]